MTDPLPLPPPALPPIDPWTPARKATLLSRPFLPPKKQASATRRRHELARLRRAIERVQGKRKRWTSWEVRMVFREELPLSEDVRKKLADLKERTFSIGEVIHVATTWHLVQLRKKLETHQAREHHRASVRNARRAPTPVWPLVFGMGGIFDFVSKYIYLMQRREPALSDAPAAP